MFKYSIMDAFFQLSHVATLVVLEYHETNRLCKYFMPSNYTQAKGRDILRQDIIAGIRCNHLRFVVMCLHTAFAFV